MNFIFRTYLWGIAAIFTAKLMYVVTYYQVFYLLISLQVIGLLSWLAYFFVGSWWRARKANNDRTLQKGQRVIVVDRSSKFYGKQGIISEVNGEFLKLKISLKEYHYFWKTDIMRVIKIKMEEFSDGK